MRKFFGTLALSIAVSLSAGATTYDVVGSFSASNPSGPFTYGYGNSVTGFMPFNTGSNLYYTLGGFAGIYYSLDSAPTLPIIGHSPTGISGFYTNSVLASELFVQAGAAVGNGGPGYDAIIQFTVPVTGSYTGSVTFNRDDTTTNGNGSTGAIYSQSGMTITPLDAFTLLPTNGATHTYTFTGATFNAGDVIVFDLGANGEYQFDGTGFSGSLIGPTPEPSSLALLGTGVMGLAGFARRRFARS